MVEPVGVAAASRWPALAAERTLALIADLVLVVQAHEGAGLDLACAEVACSRRIEVAVVPGPIDAPASRASNRLLAGGARVVCDSREALDALFGVGATTAGRDGFGSCSGRKARPRAAEGRPRRPAASRIHERPLVALDPGQQAVLDLLVAGERTLAQLGDELADADGAAIAVAGLELSGLAVRGDDGRYRSRSAGHLR